MFVLDFTQLSLKSSVLGVFIRASCSGGLDCSIFFVLEDQIYGGREDEWANEKDNLLTAQRPVKGLGGGENEGGFGLPLPCHE